MLVIDSKIFKTILIRIMLMNILRTLINNLFLKKFNTFFIKNKKKLSKY